MKNKVLFINEKKGLEIAEDIVSRNPQTMKLLGKEQSDAVSVLRERIKTVSLVLDSDIFDEKEKEEEREYVKSISEALLALESLDRLEKWLDNDIGEIEHLWKVMGNRTMAEEQRVNILREVREVLEK